MRKSFVLITGILFFCSYSLLNSTAWKINTDKIVVHFTLPQGGNEHGHFTGVEGKINFDDAAPEKSSFSAIIDVKTLSTGDDAKNENLLSEEFLDAAKFPKISFTSAKISAVKGSASNIHFIAEGKLQIKKVIKKISFPFTFEKKDSKGLFKGEFEIFAGDYGVMKKSKTGTDKVKITLEIPVTKE